MERELPIYPIRGTDFFVDVQRDALFQKDNPEKVIYLKNTDYVNNSYFLDYDLVTKTQQDYNMDTDHEMVVACIPSLCKLDAEGMALKYNKHISEVIGNKDVIIKTDQKALMRRMGGILPILVMGKQFYLVDLNKDLLRPLSHALNDGIPLSETFDRYKKTLDDKDTFEFAYDLRTHTVAEIDHARITSLPPDIILVRIPIPEILDPVGYAREHGFKTELLLVKAPVLEHHIAKMVPWEKSHLKTTIDWNRERKAREISATQQNRRTNGQGKKNKGQGKARGL